MFGFLFKRKETCMHECGFTLINKYVEQDMQDAFLASNCGGTIKLYCVEVRKCKNCGKEYKKYSDVGYLL